MKAILDVNCDFESLDEETEFFSKLGIPIIRCLGPDTSAGCPILNGSECPKVKGASLILCQLDLDTEDHRKILEAYRTSDSRLIVIVSPEQKERWASLLAGLETIVGPPSPTDLERFAETRL